MKRALGIVMLTAGTAVAAPHRPPPVHVPDRPPPKPTSIDVTVVEVAGTLAYIQPGAKGGVHRTAVVTIGGKEHRVIETTDSYGVIELARGAVHEKDKGKSTVVEEEVTEPPPPPPHPLSTWEHAWTEEQPPASSQSPTFVPIGEASRSRKFDAVFAMTSGGLIPLSGQPGSSIGFVQVDARVHAEPFSVPAAFDFNGTLQFWAADDLSARVGGQTRPYIYVRQLLASYGNPSGWYAGLGRMQYAATTLGMLDGVRLQAPLPGGITLAAFGGFVPNPLGGELAVDAQRFGVEARLYRPDLQLRPEAALVLHGSMFGGAPDERRASVMFGIYPGHSRFGGHVEVSNFDANNPWKANPVEVTAAGLDESTHIGPFEIGARIDLVEPERSRWLSSYLPSSWFCRTVPMTGVPVGQEPCDGESSMRAQAAINLGYSKGIVSITAGANAMADVSHGSDPRVIGGFLSGRIVRVAKVLHFDLTANYSNATYVSMFGGTATVGVTVWHDALDVAAYYRRSELEYAVDSTFLEQNGIGGTMTLFPTSSVMLAVQGETIIGNDINAVMILGTVVWRPRF